MSLGLRIYTNLDNNNQPVDPIADTVDGGRSGRFLWEDVVFRGDTGDVVFSELYMHNTRDDKQYRDVTLSTRDINPNDDPMSEEIENQFSVQIEGGETVVIDSQEVGADRIQYYQEPNALEIPTDPELYEETLNIGDIGPNGATDDTKSFFVMGVVDPLTPTQLFTEVQIEVESKETAVV